MFLLLLKLSYRLFVYAPILAFVCGYSTVKCFSKLPNLRIANRLLYITEQSCGPDQNDDADVFLKTGAPSPTDKKLGEPSKTSNQEPEDRALIESYFRSSDVQANKVICGDHIVSEFFEYVPRETESEKIVNFMKNRQVLRSGSKAPMDKRNNRLIAVPGSPGSGKSTFFKHFPSSEAYKKYIAEKTMSDEPAIVSSLSFNGGMDNKLVDALGLRVLYGALIANGFLNASVITWKKFLTQFSSLSRWSAQEAVEFLREIFGSDRPILLLVDEISKGVNSEDIMQQLGRVLDGDGNCDVVVSSLSPQFVAELLTKSNRQIHYAVLESLLEARLGKEECLAWANKMIENAGGPEKVDPFVQALLRNMYLLYGGYPRALENMVIELRNIENWRHFDSVIGNPESFKVLLFFKILEELPVYNAALKDMSEEDLISYICSNPSVFSVDDIRSRELVETGKLLIHELKPGNRFSTFVQCIGLLNFPSTRTYTTSKMKTVQELLRSFKFCSNVDSLWERVVALNIVTRSGTDTTSTCSMEGLLGIKPIKGDFLSLWNINVEKHDKYDPKSDYDCLVLPSDNNHPGNDGSLHLFEKKLNIRFRFFLQMKVSAPGNLLDVVASMVCFNVLEAMRDDTLDLANCHMILYIWNLSDTSFELVEQGKDTVLSKVTKMIETITAEASNKKMDIPLRFEDNVRSFIINYYSSNIHAIKGAALRGWLSPSLLPLPLFFTEIELSC